MLLNVQGTPKPKKNKPNINPSNKEARTVCFEMVEYKIAGHINVSHQYENGAYAQTKLAPARDTNTIFRLNTDIYMYK